MHYASVVHSQTIVSLHDTSRLTWLKSAQKTMKLHNGVFHFVLKNDDLLVMRTQHLVTCAFNNKLILK